MINLAVMISLLKQTPHLYKKYDPGVQLNPIPGGISPSYSGGYGKFASPNFSMK